MKPAATHSLHLVFGLTAWFAWFCLAYGALSIACAVAPPEPQLGPYTWVNAALLAGSIAIAAALGLASLAALRRLRRQNPGGRDRFMAQIAAALYGTASVATLFGALPLVLLPPCV